MVVQSHLRGSFAARYPKEMCVHVCNFHLHFSFHNHLLTVLRIFRVIWLCLGNTGYNRITIHVCIYLVYIILVIKILKEATCESVTGYFC
jgi:hypothetical protein